MVPTLILWKELLSEEGLLARPEAPREGRACCLQHMEGTLKVWKALEQLLDCMCLIASTGG
jgi:hypothetical protein